nr:MAG TPA: hypothetical protein [Caudoviricetes sp.]
MFVKPITIVQKIIIEIERNIFSIAHHLPFYIITHEITIHTD